MEVSTYTIKKITYILLNIVVLYFICSTPGNNYNVLGFTMISTSFLQSIIYAEIGALSGALMLFQSFI